MTDAYIEEIYILARESFNAGQTKFHVQALPFHMTAENMQRHRDSPWYPFWLKLKEGYDSFEATGKPPIVKVCSKQYLVNVRFPGRASDPAPDETCPAYAKLDPASIQTIDGVPPTVLANLSKPEQATRAPAQAPAIMTASMQAAPGNSLAAPPPLVDMSASAVITRPGPKPSLIVSTQTPKPPASLVYAAPDRSSIGQTASAQARSGTAQSVNYQIGSVIASPAKAAPSANAAPSGQAYELGADDALQKLNRSGKGGKLPNSSDQQASALSIGDAQPAPEAQR